LSDLKELNQTASRFMDSHSVISNKPRLHTKKQYSYNKNPESLRCEEKHMSSSGSWPGVWGAPKMSSLA